MIKLLPYILFEKYTNILALEVAGVEPALCQLYRRTIGPCSIAPKDLIYTISYDNLTIILR